MIFEHKEPALSLNVEHLLRTADTLEQALLALQGCTDPSSVLYDLYRNAAIQLKKVFDAAA